MQPDRILFDFESGNLEGWHAEGGAAFGPRPVSPPRDLWPDLTQERLGYRFLGWEGDYLLTHNGTLDDKNKWFRPQQVPPGALVSEPFMIDRNTLTFRFGAMLHPAVRVVLVVDGRVVAVAHGNNAFDLRRRSWDVRPWRGQRAHLRVEIGATEKVLLRVDHFLLTDAPADDEACLTRPAVLLDNPYLRPGRFEHVLDTSSSPGVFESASVMFAADGRWHLYALQFKHPEGHSFEKNDSLWRATATDLRGPWSPLQPVFHVDAAAGETWLMKPQVIVADGVLHLFYIGSGLKRPESEDMEGEIGIHHATSRDGLNWKREAGNPIVQHSPIIEDLCVTRVENEWILYVTTWVAVDGSGDKRSTIVAHRSPDLHTWSREWQLVGTGVDRVNGFSLGDLNVFRRGRYWYLVSRGLKTFRGRTRYCFSEVWRSVDPFCFDFHRDYVGLLDIWGSAPFVRDFDGRWYTGHLYYHSGGFWLAPLTTHDGQADDDTSLPKPLRDEPGPLGR